ncbi:signal peptidase I [Bacillus sp. SM2101]|uniref:signal peptidase I n=1 Tax=Bacillaceae TaxID=186817 RepID=UPI001BDF153A
MKVSTEKEAWSWIKTILLVLVIVIVCRQYIFEPIKVEGDSMSPTFKNKDKVIVSKISKLQHFDMIVFNSPTSNENTYYIKRIIGLPGDTVEIKDDFLYINGDIFEEPYLTAHNGIHTRGNTLTEDLKVTVPKGMLYVLGDNRKNSIDSRNFGFISEKDLVGEVKFRYSPLNEIGLPK